MSADHDCEVCHWLEREAGIPVSELHSALRDYPPKYPDNPDRDLIDVTFAFGLALLRSRQLLHCRRSGRRLAMAGIRLVRLLLLMAAHSSGPNLTPDGGDLTRVPSSPLLLARTILTAAPPARVPCPAGATG